MSCLFSPGDLVEGAKTQTLNPGVMLHKELSMTGGPWVKDFVGIVLQVINRGKNSQYCLEVLVGCTVGWVYANNLQIISRKEERCLK